MRNGTGAAGPALPQAVILAGGRGTRLSALWADRPKALVPVAGRPFIEWQLAQLAAAGITRVHIAAGHMAEALLDWLRSKGTALETGARCSVFSVRELLAIRHSRFTVSLSCEPEPRGTGGGLKFVEPWIEGDVFFTLNGDSLLPHLDFPMIGKKAADFSNYWKKAGTRFPMIGNALPVVLAVSRIEAAGRYGTVEFDEQGRVTAFSEKAHREAGWVNGGVYVFSRALLNLIPPDQNLSLETDIFPEWARLGVLAAWPAPPPLLDMGTPEGLSALETFLAGGGQTAS